MTHPSHHPPHVALSMGPPPHTPLDLLTQRFVLMERVTDVLIAKTCTGEFWPELYDRVEAVLASLPLATGDFALASRLLHNAWRYARQTEFGPAAFELRLLRGQLATLP